MRVFKQHRRGGTTENFYVELLDARGIRRRMPGFTDRKATEALGRIAEELRSLAAVGERPTLDLARKVEALPPATRERLIRFGLLDSARTSSTRTLKQHVEDYRESLAAAGNTAQHVEQTAARALRVFVGCGFTYWSDIDPAKVERFLRAEREAGLSTRSSNAILGAASSFCRWMSRMGRAIENPLRVLRPLRADATFERRALTADELRQLIAAAEHGPERYGMPGPDRAMLYLLASETGLRSNELRSLTVGSFELGSERPTVALQAAYSKRRRADVLPLKASTAKALGAFLRARAGLPKSPAFAALPAPGVMARMVREDAAAAGIVASAERAKGEPVLDFHGLRHSFVSSLRDSGVDVKLAQTLARHSTITLTMDRYTHLRPTDERRAIEGLPDLLATPADADSLLRRTGTDGSAGVADSVTESARTACDNMRQGATRAGRATALEALQAHAGGPAVEIANPLFPGSIPGAASTFSAGKTGEAQEVASDAAASVADPVTDPAFGRLAQVWPTLPERVRAALLALAETALPFAPGR